jgi:hypothetical protein
MTTAAGGEPLIQDVRVTKDEWSSEPRKGFYKTAQGKRSACAILPTIDSRAICW